MESAKSTTEVLAFDCGTDIVGILDVNTGSYCPYRGKFMADGARRLFDCEGIIVSFNGTRYDLPQLTGLLGSDGGYREPRGEHVDMQIEASRDRWPPDPGTSPILGVDLRRQYEHYFGDTLPEIPDDIEDEYERSNWVDCRMTADLWKRLCCNQVGESGFRR